MDTKATILRVLLLAVQLVCGCAHFEPAPMDPVYGDGTSMEVAVESPVPYKPSIWWSRAAPEAQVEAVADEPSYGISDMLAVGTVNLLRAFVGRSRTVVQPAPQIVVHKVARMEHHQSKSKPIQPVQPKPVAQARPKPVELKPVHHKTAEHKRAPARESQKKK